MKLNSITKILGLSVMFAGLIGCSDKKDNSTIATSTNSTMNSASSAAAAKTQAALASAVTLPTTANPSFSGHIKKEQLFNIVKSGVVMIDAKARNDKSSWAGTGFIVDLAQGLIMTNAHVAGEIRSVCTFEITFGNGTKTDAKVRYIDPCYDLAILEVEPQKIPTDCIQLEICNEPVTENMKVFAMGNSWRNSFSTYQGIVFDVFSIVGLHVYPEQSFQFSGLTVGGASGSPVFRYDGKVIGIIYGGALISGAALPSSYILPILEKVRRNEDIQRFFCGGIFAYATTQDLNEAGVLPDDFVESYNQQFPEAKRKILCVKQMYADSHKDSIRAGDVIISIDDQNIGCHLHRIEDIIQAKNGTPIKVCVYRNGTKENAKIYPQKVCGLNDFSLIKFDDASFREVKDGIMGKQKGVYLTCEYNSPFHEAMGWHAGSLIKSIDGVEIKTLDDVFNVIPKLFHKKWFQITFYAKSDNGEKTTSYWIKHDPKFVDEACFYTYNAQKRDFDIKRLPNPMKA